MDYVEYIIDTGADLESIVIGYCSFKHTNNNESRNISRRTPLDAMAAMDDDKSRALIDLVERKRPQLLRKHADSMLRHAFSSGRLATVKVRMYGRLNAFHPKRLKRRKFSLTSHNLLIIMHVHFNGQ